MLVTACFTSGSLRTSVVGLASCLCSATSSSLPTASLLAVKSVLQFTMIAAATWP
jgi:hypothetical protein